MSELEMVVPERNVAPRSRPVRCCMVRSAKSMLSARCDPSGFPRPATRSCRVVKVRFLNLWHKSEIPDLCQDLKTLAAGYDAQILVIVELAAQGGFHFQRGVAVRTLAP